MLFQRFVAAALICTAFSGAAFGYAKKPADPFANATITCNAWQGRHSNDPKVDWDKVADQLSVVLKFSDEGWVVSADFPNSAFPPGLYPPDVADTKPGIGTLRTADRLVYQSISRSVIDTITVTGLASGKFEAVWQRFRLDDGGAHPIVLQGRCTRTSPPPGWLARRSLP